MSMCDKMIFLGLSEHILLSKRYDAGAKLTQTTCLNQYCNDNSINDKLIFYTKRLLINWKIMTMTIFFLFKLLIFQCINFKCIGEKLVKKIFHSLFQNTKWNEKESNGPDEARVMTCMI